LHANSHSTVETAQRFLADREPAAEPYLGTTVTSAMQPAAAGLTDQEPVYAEASAAKDRRVRMSAVKARWAARPRPRLPEAEEWSAKLALAIIQALTGQRPAAQPTR
jgi:hypothetical protein